MQHSNSEAHLCWPSSPGHRAHEASPRLFARRGIRTRRIMTDG